jgi:peptide chain release factor 2
LIRISPFDSAGRRHTAFAAVDVTPDLGDSAEIEVDWEDNKIVREDVFRAGGAGGQKVNKTSSAIRLTHLPSGVVVQCQNERSQHQNRALARKMLVAKLYQLEQEREEQANAARRGEKSKIGFGGQTIRHYVLQPQQFVKDDRTDLKQSNPHEVLDGALDPFIEAYLRWSIAK